MTPMSLGPEPLPVMVTGLEADLIARVEALLAPHHQRVAVRTISLDDAGGSGPGEAAVIVAAVGTTPIDDEPRLLRMLRYLAIPIVLFTALDDDSAVLEALRRRAAGYLLADISGEELVAALTRAAAGRIVVDVAIGGRIAGRLAHRTPHDQLRLDDWDLRPRERQVLELLLYGRTNREIAQEINLGEETVKTYLRSVYRKLGARDRSQAIAITLRRR
jgi:DNA-binding NarL/FixJ family response regulator